MEARELERQQPSIGRELTKTCLCACFDSSVHGLIQLLVAICVMTGYAITTSSFAIYEVQEHHSGAKRLQHISGIGEPLYWTVNFLYDMVTAPVYFLQARSVMCMKALFSFGSRIKKKSRRAHIWSMQLSDYAF